MCCNHYKRQKKLKKSGRKIVFLMATEQSAYCDLLIVVHLFLMLLVYVCVCVLVIDFYRHVYCNVFVVAFNCVYVYVFRFFIE